MVCFFFCVSLLPSSIFHFNGQLVCMIISRDTKRECVQVASLTQGSFSLFSPSPCCSYGFSPRLHPLQYRNSAAFAFDLPSLVSDILSPENQSKHPGCTAATWAHCFDPKLFANENIAHWIYISHFEAAPSRALCFEV